MTIEELWQNLKPMVNKLESKVEKLQPLVGKVDGLENKVDKFEPLVGKVSNLESKVDKLEPLVEKVNNLESKVDKLEPLVDEVHDMKEMMHEIKDVNMTSMIKLQMETMQEIRKTNQKLDQYLEKNEVEHKKFEYEIANLEWKSKIAN